MPGPGRVHCQGGGAQHVASAGRRGPLVRAEMRGAEHPPRPRRRAWGPRACSRPAPASSPSLRVGPVEPPSCPAAPGEAAYLRPSARAAGAAAGAGATPPPEGADARTPPAHATEPPPRCCPAHAAGARPRAEPVPSRCRRRAALRGAAGTTTPTMPRAAGRLEEGMRARAGRGQRRRPEGRGRDPQRPAALLARGVTRGQDRAARSRGFCGRGRGPERGDALPAQSQGARRRAGVG